MSANAPGLTGGGYRLVLLITALSVGHHVDHVLRDVTGWPIQDEFNAFSASLFVYPVIVAGLILSRPGRVGARFWASLAGGAALFILAVHVGPAAAGDSVTAIRTNMVHSPEMWRLAVLVLFVVALVLHCVVEVRRIQVQRHGSRQRCSVTSPSRPR